MSGHRETWRVLTLWGFGLFPFRINLPIQTYSAHNFRGEYTLAGGGRSDQGQKSSMGITQGQPGGEDGTTGQGWDLGKKNGAAARVWEVWRHVLTESILFYSFHFVSFHLISFHGTLLTMSPAPSGSIEQQQTASVP